MIKHGMVTDETPAQFGEEFVKFNEKLGMAQPICADKDKLKEPAPIKLPKYEGVRD